MTRERLHGLDVSCRCFVRDRWTRDRWTARAAGDRASPWDCVVQWPLAIVVGAVCPCGRRWRLDCSRRVCGCSNGISQRAHGSSGRRRIGIGWSRRGRRLLARQKPPAGESPPHGVADAPKSLVRGHGRCLGQSSGTKLLSEDLACTWAPGGSSRRAQAKPFGAEADLFPGRDAMSHARTVAAARARSLRLDVRPASGLP